MSWSFAQSFASQFQASRSDLETRVDSAKSSPNVTEELFKELSSELVRLAKSLADATGSLPSYDQRQYEEQLKAMERSLSDLQKSSLPKSKFAFKRKTTAPVPNNLPRPTDSPSLRDSASHSAPTTTNLALFGRTHQLLTLDALPSSSLSQDLAIRDLDNCIVNLLPSPQDDTPRPISHISALHIQNVADSVLLLPPINGSVLIHNLRRCTIVVGCHQYRMHTSQNVDVYLAITSNPIIEHCSDIRFGAYPNIMGLAATNSSKHLDVLDFSHIRSDPSPHWSTLGNDRVSPCLPLKDISTSEDLNVTRQRMLPA